MLGVSLRQKPAKGFQSLNPSSAPLMRLYSWASGDAQANGRTSGPRWLAIRRVVVDLAPLVPNSHALTT
jgi:hypothetical protein